MGLMDIYLDIAGMDEADQKVVEEQVKEAAVVQEAAVETVKMAHDYDAAGRRLAHALWGQQKMAGLGFPGKEEPEKEREAEREGSENKPKAKKAPPEREDEGEDKEKKREKEGDGEEQEVAEKKASILARAAEDPEFREKLLNWHSGS